MTEHLLDPPHVLPTLGEEHLRPGLHVFPDSTDGTVLVRLEGELDMGGAPRLGQVLNEALDDPGSVAVVLDLSELTFIDSTGVRVLIVAHRRASGRGCPFVLRYPSRSVMKVLRLTGLDQLMAIEGAPSNS